MLSKYIQVGNKIDIESVRKSRNEYGEIVRKTYKSELYEIVSEDQIKIAMPMEQMKVVLLPVDGEYSLCFFTPKGLYQCLARVTERYKSNNLFVLVMELESGLKRYQRREYYRLNTVLNMKSRQIDEGINDEDEIPEEGAAETEQVEFLDTDLAFDDGIMVDISGGGARFISRAQYKEGCLIRFVFELFVNGSVTEYKLIGRVLKADKVENKPGFYQIRIQFVNIVNEDRESIIKYIFEEERKQRQRDRN